MAGHDPAEGDASALVYEDWPETRMPYLLSPSLSGPSRNLNRPTHEYVGDYDAQHEKHNVLKKCPEQTQPTENHQGGDSSDGQSTRVEFLCPIQTSYDLFSFLSF